MTLTNRFLPYPVAISRPCLPSSLWAFLPYAMPPIASSPLASPCVPSIISPAIVCPRFPWRRLVPVSSFLPLHMCSSFLSSFLIPTTVILSPHLSTPLMYPFSCLSLPCPPSTVATALCPCFRDRERSQES